MAIKSSLNFDMDMHNVYVVNINLEIINETYPDWCRVPVNSYNMSISNGVI